MTAKKELTVNEYDLGQILQVKPQKAIKYLVKGLGQKVKRGELIASKKGFLKKRNFFAPIEGILDSLTEEGILRIKAPTKKKVKVKPARPAGGLPFPKQAGEIKGNWGKGGQALGELFCLEEKAALFNLKGKHQDQILALAGKLNRGLWHKAKGVGVKGIICGELPDEEFAKEIEKEVLLVGREEKSIALPLVVLGEKGKISEKVWQTLKKNQGKKVFIEGDNNRVLIPK